MKGIKIESAHWKETGGTCLQGYVSASFAQLVRAFGQPDPDLECDKSDAEWDLKINGQIITIYNWKDGQAYLGESGAAVDEITDWHIGGFDATAELLVKRALAQVRAIDEEVSKSQINNKGESQ